MESLDDLDWGEAAPRDLVARIADAELAQVDRLAREYDWSRHPIPVMAAILKRADCPLATALTIFLNCNPDAAPEGAASGPARQLARIIEQAVNTGRFRHDPDFGLDDDARERLAVLASPAVDPQGADWALDPAIIAPLLQPSRPPRRRRLLPTVGVLRGLSGLLRPQRSV